MIGIRKLLDFVFTQRELKILDDVMPESAKRSKEEEKQKLEEEMHVSDQDMLIFYCDLYLKNILSLNLQK